MRVERGRLLEMKSSQLAAEYHRAKEAVRLEKKNVSRACSLAEAAGERFENIKTKLLSLPRSEPDMQVRAKRIVSLHHALCRASSQVKDRKAALAVCEKQHAAHNVNVSIVEKRLDMASRLLRAQSRSLELRSETAETDYHAMIRGCVEHQEEASLGSPVPLETLHPALADPAQQQCAEPSAALPAHEESARELASSGSYTCRQAEMMEHISRCETKNPYEMAVRYTTDSGVTYYVNVQEISKSVAVSIASRDKSDEKTLVDRKRRVVRDLEAKGFAVARISVLPAFTKGSNE